MSGQVNSAEINCFIDEGVGHIKVIIPAEIAFDEQGTVTIADPDIAKIAAIYNGLTQTLIAGGHKLGREAPRQYGGGRGGSGAPKPPAKLPTGDEAVCPKCKGGMWDNVAENDEREKKQEKLRPDFKCRDKTCDGIIWRPKGGWVTATNTDPEEAA